MDAASSIKQYHQQVESGKVDEIGISRSVCAALRPSDT